MQLFAAAAKTENILREPAPFVLQNSLGDFYVDYELNAYAAGADEMPSLYSELHKDIQDECASRSIKILSPHHINVRN